MALPMENDSLLPPVNDEQEYGNEHIHDRIRHLEAVTSRARERRRWPPVHSPIQITNFTAEATSTTTGDAVQGEGREQHQAVEIEEGIVEKGKEGKKKGAHLIAKALEVEETNAVARTGNFFDCNVCLNMAKEPVLTCCGHLFCWPCFYQLPYAYLDAKECPVCEGEVTETGITPIYGNANAKGGCQSEMKKAGLRVPPRPQAPRIEGVRQQLISQGAPSSIAQNIHQFNNLFGGLGGGQVQSGRPSSAAADRNHVLHFQSLQLMDNNRRTGSHPIPRLLAQGGDDSFSSLSSALNSAMDSAERLVEDFESYIHNPHLGGSRRLNPLAVNGNSSYSVAATSRLESLARDVAATSSASAAFVSSVNSTVDAIAAMDLGIQTTNVDLQINPLDPSSSYNRRRRRRNDPRQSSNGPRRRLR